MDHGNSNSNSKPHHLYAFFDNEEGVIFKYGISHKPIRANGLCRRMQEQLDSFNRISSPGRYSVELILTDIPGRRAAKKIETEYIRAFAAKHGQRPRGNLVD